MHIHIHTYTHIHRHMHTYTYIYMHIYTHTYTISTECWLNADIIGLVLMVLNVSLTWLVQRVWGDK